MRAHQKTAIWKPNLPHETNVEKFINYVNQKHDLQIETYHDLHRWSVDETTFQDFWTDAYIWLQLSPQDCSTPGFMLANKVASPVPPLFPPPTFFPSAFLNIAEIILRDRKDGDVAIYFAREGVDGLERITWGNIREQVRQLRSAMIRSGVKRGDVVAAVMGNSVNAIIAALATLSIGAVWTSASCDLGPSSIIDRYSQVSPKVVFADDGYVYAGKLTNLSGRISQWSGELRKKNGNELVNVVVVPYCGTDVNFSSISGGCTLADFLARDKGDDELGFEMVPFSQPAFILYSSGTVGGPKCIIHSMGGVALKVKVDMTLQHDIRSSDVVFQYTTTSWVMWVLNFVNLSCGAGMLLYDGSPFHPRPTILLELAEQIRVGVFGTSPRYLSTLKSLDIVPRKKFDLSKLRVVTSTGSALPASMYHWFYSTAFPPSVHLVSMSGGTDIAGCFVGSSPLLPVYPGEIQCKALGMSVGVYDSEDVHPTSVEDSGGPGELVCTKPFPSQPLGFGGEGGREKYESSYFSRFGPRVWCQGDFVQILQDTGGIMMLGRSDGVLNPSGVRFGSAEIYTITETLPEISDCICVGQRREIDEDERVLLFVKMSPGQSLTAELETKIASAIREGCSPRHVPRGIFEVSDIPYTLNGKKCEINVKHVVNGRKVTVNGAIANPEALKLYEKYRELPSETSQGLNRAKI